MLTFHQQLACLLGEANKVVRITLGGCEGVESFLIVSVLTGQFISREYVGLF
jgi:hypothetical protein